MYSNFSVTSSRMTTLSFSQRPQCFSSSGSVVHDALPGKILRKRFASTAFPSFPCRFRGFIFLRFFCRWIKFVQGPENHLLTIEPVGALSITVTQKLKKLMFLLLGQGLKMVDLVCHLDDDGMTLIKAFGNESEFLFSCRKMRERMFESLPLYTTPAPKWQ